MYEYQRRCSVILKRKNFDPKLFFHLNSLYKVGLSRHCSKQLTNAWWNFLTFTINIIIYVTFTLFDPNALPVHHALDHADSQTYLIY